MSARTRELPRRSCLTVPGSSERFLAKAATLPVDEVILDLEDAVAESSKAAARRKVAGAVRDLDWGERVVFVRVNGWESRHTYLDVIDVVTASGPRLDGLVLPKAGSAPEVAALDLLLSQLERNARLQGGHVGLEVQIESASGLAAVREITAVSKRLEAVVLGPVDLAASLGLPRVGNGAVVPDGTSELYDHVLVELLVAGRVNGLQVIDGPYLALDDLAGLEAVARRRAALGLDGKWAVHPSQIDKLNEAFTPAAGEVAGAEALLAAIGGAAAAPGRGALRYEGEMVDAATRKVAERILARAARGRKV